jgi:hypothetical protein
MAVAKSHDIFVWCAGPNLYVNIGSVVFKHLRHLSTAWMAYSGKLMYISAWDIVA